MGKEGFISQGFPERTCMSTKKETMKLIDASMVLSTGDSRLYCGAA